MPRLSDGAFIGALLLACVVAAAVYWPGLSGPFLLDDFSSLELVRLYFPDIASVALSRADQAGLPGRPVSMLSFILSAEDYPFDAWSFKYVNLCLHIITGLAWTLLLFVTCTNSKVEFLKANARSVSLFSASIWLLHPLNVSTVLYVVQRMTILASLFVILALIAFVYGKTLSKKSRGVALLLLWFAYPLLLLLGILSKENAVLGLPLTLLIDFFLLSGRDKFEPRQYRYWKVLYVVIPCIALFAIVALSIPSYLSTYDIREFSLSERLLTQARVLSRSLYNLLIPTSTSANVFYDGFAVSRSIFTPPTTAAAIALIAILILSSIRMAKTLPIFSFAVLWFLTGHLLESTFIPLELYFEHRNYLPSLGITFLIGCALVFISFKISRIQQALLYFFILSSLTFSTHSNTTTWSDADSLAAYSHMQHPESVRAAEFFVNRLIIHDENNEAGRVISRTLKKNPNNIGLLLLQIYHECLHPGTTEFRRLDIDTARTPLSTGNLNLGAVGLVQQLTDSVVAGKCKAINGRDMHKIIDSLLENHSFQKSSISMHNLYIAKATLYTHERNLNKTMVAIQNAINNKDMTRTYFLAANILLSAGQDEIAIDFLKAALARNQARIWPLTVIYKDSIDRFIHAIETDMKQQSQKE